MFFLSIFIFLSFFTPSLCLYLSIYRFNYPSINLSSLSMEIYSITQWAVWLRVLLKVDNSLPLLGTKTSSMSSVPLSPKKCLGRHWWGFLYLKTHTQKTTHCLARCPCQTVCPPLCWWKQERKEEKQSTMLPTTGAYLIPGNGQETGGELELQCLVTYHPGGSRLNTWWCNDEFKCKWHADGGNKLPPSLGKNCVKWTRMSSALQRRRNKHEHIVLPVYWNTHTKIWEYGKQCNGLTMVCLDNGGGSLRIWESVRAPIIHKHMEMILIVLWRSAHTWMPRGKERGLICDAWNDLCDE